MSEYTNACNDLLDAIQLTAASSVEKAEYDKTIQAQILSCQDATIGKYRCRYQDAIIYAYASSSNVAFSNGAYVYILVPNGNMSNEKTILGTTQKLGVNYISQVVGDQAYNVIGNNAVTSDNTLYLNTNNENYRRAVYQYGSTRQVTLDVTALEKYIKQSSSLIAGATFKTSISAEKQYRGHYGITYNLRFLDNTTNKQVVRSYTVDEDDMIDNPYRLVYATRQYKIFDVDGPNFIRVDSIQIFNSDFPNATGSVTSDRLTSGDIEITRLQISGAVRMSESEIGGVAITFSTPQGAYFIADAPAGSTKTITAQVRVKGKLVSAAQKIPFYWGVENISITSKSEYYNKYLGKGWKCLNKSNVITKGTETVDPVIEWVPDGDTFILKLSDATAKDNKFKVAIVYDGNVITKEINIQNLAASAPTLTIQSSAGTKFYYDIGHPTLTCKINGSETLENYVYYWAYQDNSGGIEFLSQTIELNNDYDTKVRDLQNLKQEIANGTKFLSAQRINLANKETAVKAFDFIQRVDKNKIYDVQISNITQFGVFKCSVYNSNDVYLGTASITLTNLLEGEGIYSLIINNGSVTYQYNEDGIAPNSKSLDVPQQIQGLSFTVYDNLGNEIDNDIILNDRNNCKIRWYFPIKQTLLIDRNTENSGTDPTLTYKYYDDRVNLVYDIAQKYDIKKQRNQVKLTVDYKGISLTAETNLTFTKQGQPGTNGTQYLVKLVPNTIMNDPPLWPMITKAGSSYFLNYQINGTKSEQTIGTNYSYPFLKAQLWRSGQLVWQGFSNSDAAKDNLKVSWSILANKYSPSSSDASAFEVAETTGLIRYKGDTLASSIMTPYANIIKCSITWQNKTYYGTLPITTAWTSSTNYRINLKDYTGWRYAVYTSDGVLPQYDSSYPFEFVMLEKIGDFWEDISLVQGSHAVIFYPPVAIGSPTPINNKKLIEVLGITDSGAEDPDSIYRKDCTKNQWQARPISRYDGICVNAAITQICRNNSGNIIGRISVPIHFLLNKYGLSHINEWDGNSVQVNQDGGFILSPQMGAGQKVDNKFTGVLMGTVRDPGKTTDQIGLLGYSGGDRTFFLNSKNGSALFGKSNGAQVTIDPSTNRALIYSGAFWKNYDAETGLPSYGGYTGANFYKNYRIGSTDKPYEPNVSNINKSGMIIDLTTPQIYFGSGTFCVTKTGQLYATGATIAGAINATSGTIGASNAKKIIIGTNTTNAAIYSDKTSVSDNTNGFYIGVDGIAFGADTFKVFRDGTVKIKGTIIATSLDLGGNQISWENDIKDKPNLNVYISKGGKVGTASLPSDPIPDSTKAFQVSTNGLLQAENAVIRGTIYATKGQIGGWTISGDGILTNETASTTDGSVALMTKNFTRYVRSRDIKNLRFAIGGDFAVDSTGKLYASSAEIGSWSLDKKGSFYTEGTTSGQAISILLGPASNSSKIFYIKNQSSQKDLFYVSGPNDYTYIDEFRGHFKRQPIGSTSSTNHIIYIGGWTSNQDDEAPDPGQSLSDTRIGDIQIRSSASSQNRICITSQKIYLRNSSGSACRITPNSNISGSDKRLKKNIKDLDPLLAKQLHPVSFNFVQDNKKRRYGFIAQEVQKIIPDIVEENEDGYLGLSYNDLIAPLYALVQQQQRTIEDLEQRLSKLERINNG